MWVKWVRGGRGCLAEGRNRQSREVGEFQGGGDGGGGGEKKESRDGAGNGEGLEVRRREGSGNGGKFVREFRSA